MENIEKVEKLREKANVSYEEAKEALENNNWDILDAMISLEKTGKVNEEKTANYSTEHCQGTVEGAPKPYAGEEKNVFKDFIRWCLKWIHKANTNFFKVERHDKEVLSVPISILILLLIFCFWVTIPLIIVGLFVNMKYSFVGPDIHSADVNTAMDSVSKAAENIKNEFKTETGIHNDSNNQ